MTLPPHPIPLYQTRLAPAHWPMLLQYSREILECLETYPTWPDEDTLQAVVHLYRSAIDAHLRRLN